MASGSSRSTLFGQQDQLPQLINQLATEFALPPNITKRELRNYLRHHRNHAIVVNAISALTKYVPYRFLSSWFGNELTGVSDSRKNNIITELSASDRRDSGSCLYKIGSIEVTLDSDWYSYLEVNARILTDFTLLNLSRYLERSNPQVPNIAHKLDPLHSRNLKKAKTFWDTFFRAKKTVNCIYSGAVLDVDDYCLDHFLPWSFVSHDQLWNLVPTSKSVNSFKGDCIPADKYFKAFATLQFDAFHTLSGMDGTHRLLEDYPTLFRLAYEEILKMSHSEFSRAVLGQIIPLVQIGSNMGFPSGWLWRRKRAS